jgi:hypothetical protein
MHNKQNQQQQQQSVLYAVCTCFTVRYATTASRLAVTTGVSYTECTTIKSAENSCFVHNNENKRHKEGNLFTLMRSD